MSLLELIAGDQMFPHVKPLFTGVQLWPLSVDRKAPPVKYVPAKMCPSELIASARTSVVMTPLLTSIQFCPLSVERKTPPASPMKSAPAEISPLELIARDLT